MVEAQHRFHVARLLSFNVLLSIVQVNEGVQALFLVMRVNYTCKLSSINMCVNSYVYDCINVLCFQMQYNELVLQDFVIESSYSLLYADWWRSCSFI